ncbi:MAG: thiamine pyrophosphate-dependent dehydrogenase E1 component subunit alpha [Planctomycetota bacterium]
MTAPLGMMRLIRAFEEAVDRLFREGAISGTTHLSAGQEACAVGVADALNHDDLVVSTHRGHGHLLARGADPKLVMAELCGRASGLAHGIGGSQHMADPSVGFMGSNGITGGGIPVATGIALAEKLNRSGRVTVCFLGDGAVSQGTFHESLNMAALWQLPAVYFCENNQYAMSTPFRAGSPVPRVTDRAAAYNLPGVVVDGNDYQAVRDATAAAVTRARRGEGPTLVEALTYRIYGHSKSDLCEYRPAGEADKWARRDPIRLLRERLTAQGVTTAAMDRAEAEAEAAVKAAVAFALAAAMAG